MQRASIPNKNKLMISFAEQDTKYRRVTDNKVKIGWFIDLRTDWGFKFLLGA